MTTSAGLKRDPRSAIFAGVREELRLGFAHTLEVSAVSHESGRPGEPRTISCGGCHSLIFVVEGRLAVAADGRVAGVGPGEAILLEPASTGQAELSCERETEHYRVAFGFSAPPPRSRRRTLSVPDYVSIRNPGRLKHLMRMLTEESRRHEPSPLVLHHIVVLMLCEMAASALVAAGPDAREDSLGSIASRVEAFIAAHYHEPIGTPDIARELRYNPDYLERAYRAERSQSIRAAIHARRFREAQAQLLLQGGTRIAEVAALCGYADAGYFRRVFKRTTNLTPRGYRQIHAERAELTGAAGPAGGAPVSGRP